MSRKRVHDFELTLSNCFLDKLHIYYALEELCNGIIVSQERHTGCPLFPEQHAGFHFHCYLNTIDAWKYEALRDVISSNLESETSYKGSIHISSLRNRKHWIKYITKEDTSPAWRGVDTGDFHFAWKYYTYVNGDDRFNAMDSFVRQNVQYTRTIRDAMDTTQGEKRKQAWIQSSGLTCPVKYNVHCEWVHTVLRWWNNPNSPKGLIIRGETGLGKSTVVKQILYESGVNFVRLPCGNRVFEFSNIDNDCAIAYGDDINDEYFTVRRQKLLELLDNGPVAIDAKCEKIKNITFTGRLIFCTNYNFTIDPAIWRRIRYVWALEDGTLRREKEDEVIEISDTEEDWTLPEIEDIKTELEISQTL